MFVAACPRRRLDRDSGTGLTSVRAAVKNRRPGHRTRARRRAKPGAGRLPLNPTTRQRLRHVILGKCKQASADGSGTARRVVDQPPCPPKPRDNPLRMRDHPLPARLGLPDRVASPFLPGRVKRASMGAARPVPCWAWLGRGRGSWRAGVAVHGVAWRLQRGSARDQTAVSGAHKPSAVSCNSPGG
jgi:hypothetical protein